jgi:hypothetical protein
VFPEVRDDEVRLVVGDVFPARFFVSGFFGLKIPAPPPISAPTDWPLAQTLARDKHAKSVISNKTGRKLEEARIDPLLVKWSLYLNHTHRSGVGYQLSTLLNLWRIVAQFTEYDLMAGNGNATDSFARKLMRRAAWQENSHLY